MLIQEKTKRGLHIGYWFQWGRVNAKNSIRIKYSHNRSLWAKLSWRCWSLWSKPNTWKGCVTGTMIYKVRPKRQKFWFSQENVAVFVGWKRHFSPHRAKNYSKHLLAMPTEGITVFIQGHFKGINVTNKTIQLVSTFQ